MKKVGFYIIIISIIMSLIACSRGNGGADENTPGGDSPDTTEQIETTELNAPDFEAIDMNGKNFRILTTGWCGHKPLDTTDIAAEELTGDAMNDAVYNRQIYLEDKYNISIEQINFPDHNEASRQITKAVQADDDAYDLCLIRSTNFTTLTTNHYLLDLAEIPSIELSQPWWDSNSYEALSLFGRHYGICSDITVNDELAIWCIYFNKNMIQDYSLESPYDLVSNNQWTYEKLFEMGAAVSRDLNSDGKMDKDDMFGIHHSNDTTAGMLNCIGVNFGEIDSGGYPVFTLGNEIYMTKMLSLFERLFDKENVYNFHARAEGMEEVTMFSQGNVLFNFSAIHMAQTLRMMEQDFGILPYPKFDGTQSSYMSSASPLFLTIAVVPVTNRDLGNTGIIMEEMAYEGYKNIRPAFYDLLLQGKVARDDESLTMLDYIFNNVVYDVGSLLNIGNFSWDFVTTIPNKYDLNIASYIEKKQDVIQNNIDVIVDAFK